MIKLYINFNEEQKLIPSLNPVATSIKFRYRLKDRLQDIMACDVEIEERTQETFLQFKHIVSQEDHARVKEEIQRMIEQIRLEICNEMVSISANGGLFCTEAIPFDLKKGDARRYIVDTIQSGDDRRLKYVPKRENLHTRLINGIGYTRVNLHHAIVDCIQAYLTDIGSDIKVRDYVQERITQLETDLQDLEENRAEAEAILKRYCEDPDNFSGHYDRILDETYDCDLCKVTGESASTITKDTSPTTYDVMLADWFDEFEVGEDDEVKELQESAESFDDDISSTEDLIETLEAVAEWIEEGDR